MAQKDKEKVEVEVASDARTDPRGQTVGDTEQPQMLKSAGKELALSGDKPAKVNPALDTLNVTIPIGVNEDGTTKYDNFTKGKEYTVTPELLEVKNTEQVSLLVPVDNEGGGE